MNPQAVIFDMDGVLVDTERAYQDVLRAFFRERGLEIPDEELHRLAGGAGGIYQKMIGLWWSRAPRLSERDLELGPSAATGEAFEQITDYGTLINPGVRETIAELRRRGVRVALASSSRREKIERVVRDCGLTTCFEVIVSGEDFTESKPNPAIYLHTLGLLGLPGSASVAVEDSDAGIAAARGAGIPVAVKRDERFGYRQEGGTWMLDSVGDLIPALDAYQG